MRLHCFIFYLFLPVMALYFGPFRTFLSFNIMMRSSPACSRKKNELVLYYLVVDSIKSISD
jgi:hypothetical protein